MMLMTVVGLYLASPVVPALLLGFVLAAILRLYTRLTAPCPPSATMEGKTVIITGGNGGIGKETAKEMARRGARVILACRNHQSATQVKEQIIEATKNEQIVVKKLDLSSFKSIRAFAVDVLKTEPRLDVLVHNAGMAASSIVMTEDNIESTMATNHFGPFLLTHLLMDLLKKSAPSRVVVVASDLYRLVSIDLNDINPTSSWFVPRLYYVSKYANILFTLELARRLDGTGVTANCLHPGLVDTGIWDSAPAIFKWPLKMVVKCCFKTPEQGCQTSVYVACADELEGVTGKYFSDCRERALNAGAMDGNKARKLWELSENFVHLTEDDPKI